MKIHILNFKLLGFFVLITIFFSCEEMIEIDLPSNQINTETVFKDINTAEAALASLYINIRENSIFNGGYAGMGTILGLYSDELVSFGTNTFLSNPDFYNNNLLSSNSIVNTYWTNSYSHIYAINAFIEGLNASVSIGEDDKQIFLGEAFLLRALYYQYLTQLFGDIPYTTTTDYKYNSKISKTNQLDVLVKVEADLKLALELLPTDYRHSERIYPNQAVAELLLAKNYLLQKQYDKAALFSKKVLDNSSYRLEQDLEKVFKKTAQSTLWQLGTKDSGVSTMEAMNYIFFSQPNGYYLDINFIDEFEDIDLRKEKWISVIKKDDQKWHHASKYKSYKNNTDEFSVLFRIEELYFIYAESLINLNRIDEAIYNVNLIRNRSGLMDLPLNLSKEESVLALLNESKKEFFTEQGLRFFILKRNNLLDLLEKSKPNWKEFNKILPYPERELFLNPNILPQNEGY